MMRYILYSIITLFIAGCSSQVVEKAYPDPMEILPYPRGRALGEVVDDGSYLIVEMETQDSRAQVIDWYKRQFPADWQYTEGSPTEVTFFKIDLVDCMNYMYIIDDPHHRNPINDGKYRFVMKSRVQPGSVECTKNR
ncbi:hypothetical protein [Herpetosiphon sp. NSE202]|uniref:hypothetical protein n=1 Tax=Herpetosiphon sp. NSE202 TaxID=3351349 RepID=UPI0036421DC3